MGLSDVAADMPGVLRPTSAGDVEASRRWPAIVRAVVQAGIGAGLCAWLIHSGALEPRALSRLVSAPGLVLLALALVLGNYAFLAMRLRAVMMASGGELSLRDAMRLSFASAFAGWLIPGGLGADVTKAYLLGRGMHGDAARGISVALLDRMLGLAALIVLAVAGQLVVIEQVWDNTSLRRLFVVCVGVLGGFGVLCCIAVWLSLRGSSATATRVGWVRRLADSFERAAQRPGLVVKAFAWSLGAQAMVVGAMSVVCVAITDAIPSGAVCAFIPVGLVANAVPLSPGGLGVGEAAFETLFNMAGTFGGAEIALSWRVLAVVGSLPGLWYLIRWSRRRADNRSGAGEPSTAA